jgi:NADH-quinone oxidoreductase subunit M
MFSHGILAGLMFAVVGRMVYARTHTRDLLQLSDMSISKAVPFAAATFVIAGMASMGLPGFSGFVAELMILIGTWRSYPLLALFVGLGIVIGVVYIWRAMQKAFFREPGIAPPPEHPPLPPITLPERIGAILLIAASVLVGLYPQLLLRLIQPALNSQLFAPLRSGSWQ